MSFSERSYASQSTRPSSAAASRGHNGLANAHSSFAGRSAEADGAAHTATLSSMHESTNTAGAATDSVAHSSAAAADGGEKQQPSEALQRAIAERDAEISRLRALLGAATNASDAVGGALFASRGPHHQQEDGAQGHSLTTATEESPQFIAKAMRVRPCGNAGVAGPDAELTAPDATNGHAAAFYNGRMFVFGGVSSPADASGACTSVKAGTKANGPTPHSAVVSGALWAFSPATSQWARLSGLGGDAPAPRAGHSATIVKGSLLVFGGERPPPPAGARVQHTPFYPTTPNKKASKKAAQPAPPSTHRPRRAPPLARPRQQHQQRQGAGRGRQRGTRKVNTRNRWSGLRQCTLWISPPLRRCGVWSHPAATALGRLPSPTTQRARRRGGCMFLVELRTQTVAMPETREKGRVTVRGIQTKEAGAAWRATPSAALTPPRAFGRTRRRSTGRPTRPSAAAHVRSSRRLPTPPLATLRTLMMRMMAPLPMAVAPMLASLRRCRATPRATAPPRTLSISTPLLAAVLAMVECIGTVGPAASGPLCIPLAPAQAPPPLPPPPLPRSSVGC